MPIMTGPQLARLVNLPRPPMPQVALVDPRTGKPTAAFVDYLARLDEWQRTMLRIFGE